MSKYDKVIEQLKSCLDEVKVIYTESSGFEERLVYDFMESLGKELVKARVLATCDEEVNRES